MEHHVFAVWDFMSLLKALQRSLTCVSVPWLPTGSSEAARFVNEIVLGEESDADGRGGYLSHFELYRGAMTRFGADTGPIDSFLEVLSGGGSVPDALAAVAAPPSVRAFVGHTFEVIAGGDVCRIASAFTYGREDLLPDVFRKIVDELDRRVGGLDEFRHYLERHIEVDSGEHGPMAARLIASLCGDDEARWLRVEQAAVQALTVRLALWDGILAEVDSARQSA